MNTGLLAMMFLTGLAQEGAAGGGPPPDPPGQTIVVGVSVMRGNTRTVQHVAVTIPAPPAPVDQDEDQDQPPPQPIRRITLNAAVVNRENFDGWLFGDAGDVVRGRRPARFEDAGDEAARARHLERLLQTRVEAATREHTLTPAQRAKIQLAGRGDIKRFFDQVEDRRREFETQRRVYKNGLAALRRLEPLRQVFLDGPFGDGSLFAKTLQRIDDEQVADR